MIAWIAVAAAAPITPLGPVTPSEEVAFVPYLFVYPDHLDATVYVTQGYGSVDLYLGASGSFAWPDTVAPGALELFPRFFIKDWVAIVPRVLWTPGEDWVTAGLETHWNAHKGRFYFTADAGWRPTIGGDGFAVGAAFVRVAPEVYVIEDRLSLFVEVNPWLDLTSRAWTADLLPGVSVRPSKDRADRISLGAQIPVRGGPVAVVLSGAWYP